MARRPWLRSAKLPWFNRETPPSGEAPISRKAFIQQGASQLARWGASFLGGLVDSVAPPHIRPPGALEEAAFLAACERCDLCREACPVDAIFPLSSGLGAGTPVIDPARTPCHLCEDMPCTTACPVGALLPVERLQVRMATITLHADRCLPFQGTACELCVSSCPVPQALAASEGRPVLDLGHCTGCGCCVFSCPVDAIQASPPA